MAPTPPTPVVPYLDRIADDRRKVAESAEMLAAVRLAAEQSITRAEVEREREVAEIARARAEQDAVIATAASQRAIATIKPLYVAAIADGLSPFACQRLGYAYVKLNNEHMRDTGRHLERELTLAIADHHVNVDAKAVEVFACPGTLQGGMLYGFGIGAAASEVRKALLKPNNPIHIRDTLATLTGTIAEASTRAAPRMALDEARRHWAILIQAYPEARETAALKALAAELAAPRTAAKEAQHALVRRARSGDESAIDELRQHPDLLELAKRASEALFGTLSVSFKKAAGLL